jgi:Tfp pilus assembly protein PilF
MGIEEIILNILLSLLTNGIATLADRYDDEKRKEFDELKKHLKEGNILQAITVKSLKEIKVESKEVDQLKILVNGDVFNKKLANIISSPSPENETIKFIVTEVKKYCNFSEDKTLTIEPHIAHFVTEIYKGILHNPILAPFLIIKRIDESIEISQQEHKDQKELLEKIYQKVDQVKADLNEHNNTRRDITFQPIDTRQIFPDTAHIDNPQIDSRVGRLLQNELEKTLDKLNSFFKTRTDEIKQIQKDRDFRKAIKLYESLLAEADDKIDTESILGIYADCALCSINIDDFEAANEWLNKAEGISTTDKRVLAIRGLFHYESGDNNKSRGYSEASLSADKFYHLALILLTGLELESGIEGKTLLNKYFLDDQDNLKKGFKEEHLAVIYRTIGQCYLRDNLFDNAITFFQESLSQDAFDDATLSLIGFAYLKKVIGVDTTTVHFYEKLDDKEEHLIKSAISYFNRSLEVAARYQNIKHHISTRANLSVCYMLLGQYDNAYDIAEISNIAQSEHEELIKSKAAAAYYKGSFTEAVELLSKVKDFTCQDIINEVISLLHSNKDGKEKEALDLLNTFLGKSTISTEDIAQINCLKLEILLYLKDKDGALKVLRDLDASRLPIWQKEAATGDHYDAFSDHEKADIHYQNALSQNDIIVPAKIYIAYYYFQRNEYELCYNICSSIPLNKIKTNLEIFQRLLYMAVISSFKLSKLKECREFIIFGQQQNVKDVYLNEASASIFLQDDDLEDAQDELKTVLGKRSKDKNVDVLIDLGSVSLMLGDVKTSISYFEQAEKLPAFYSNSQSVINYVVALVIIGDRIEAKRIFQKSVEYKFDNRDDSIHRFAPVFYLRENKSDLLAKYAVEFNNKHGDTEWLWKKDIKKYEEELKSIFSESIRRSQEIRNLYTDKSIPLVFLPLLTGKKEIIHLWRFNREYGLPLIIESGNPNELSQEISSLTNKKSVLLDYTALLVLMEIGKEYYWILDKLFDEILIYRPMYLNMLNELLIEEHAGLRETINYLSATKKVKFLKRLTLPSSEIEGKNLTHIIPAFYIEFFNIAQKTGLPLIIGESRLRGFINNFGIKSSGIRSLLEYAKNTKIISEAEISSAIINLIKKDCQFISFNRETLDYLFNNYKEKDFELIFEKLSNQVFLPHSELETFFNVYLGFILKCKQSGIAGTNLNYFIEKTINDVKRLTGNALVFNSLPFCNKNNFLTDMNKINLICLGYIYQLLLLIDSLKITAHLKDGFIDIVRKNANLAYWYEKKHKNIPIIKFIFDSAKCSMLQKKI